MHYFNKCGTIIFESNLKVNLKDAMIPIIGRIDEKLLRNFLIEYEKKNHAEQLSFFIHSGGGFTETAFEIAKQMIGSRGNIITLAGKEVFSAALVLHQIAPFERLAYQDSSFLIHRQYKKNSNCTLSEKEKDREWYFFNLFAMQTGKTIDEIYHMANKNTELTAYEAKEKGFVTSIVESLAPSAGDFLFLEKSV